LWCKRSFRHQWWIATHVEDVFSEEMQNREEEWRKQQQQQQDPDRFLITETHRKKEFFGELFFLVRHGFVMKRAMVLLSHSPN
jgi:hypothetical protein